MSLKKDQAHTRDQERQKALPRQRPQPAVAERPQRNRTQTGLTSGSASSQAGQGSQLPVSATEEPAGGIALRSQSRNQFRLRSQLPLRTQQRGEPRRLERPRKPVAAEASQAGQRSQLPVPATEEPAEGRALRSQRRGQFRLRSQLPLRVERGERRGRPRKPAAAEAAAATDQATAVDVLGAGDPAPGDGAPAVGFGAGGSVKGAGVAEVVDGDTSDCEFLPIGGAWPKNALQTPPLQRDRRGFRNKGPSPPTFPQSPACQRGESEKGSRFKSQPTTFGLKRGPSPTTTISSDADARGAKRQACTSIERTAVPNHSGSRVAGSVVKAACRAPAGTSSCLATAWTAFKDLVAQVDIQVLGEEQPETSPRQAPDVEERLRASAALAVAFQYVDCLCEEDRARGKGKPEPDPSLTTAMFMAAASLLQYGVDEQGSNLRNTLLNKETLAERLKQDAAFAEQYVRQNAPEDASTDLRKLEVAKQQGVWLSGVLYHAKLRHELVAVEDNVGGCITALRARAVRLAGSSTHARRALQSALKIFKTFNPELEKPHVVEQAGRAPAIQQMDLETLTRLLEQCGTPPEGPPGHPQLHVQGRDLVLQMASTSSAVAAAAPIAGVVGVLTAAAHARERGQQSALKAELTKLQAELEANESLINDSESAAKEAEASLRVGEGQLAVLRKLLDSLFDKRLYDDAVQNLAAEMRKDAAKRRIMLDTQLGAIKIELQALQIARAPWAVFASAFGESDAQLEASTKTAEQAATDASLAAEPPAARLAAPGSLAAAPASQSPMRALVKQSTGDPEDSAPLGLMLQEGL